MKIERDALKKLSTWRKRAVIVFVDIQRIKYNNLILPEILPENVWTRHSDNFFCLFVCLLAYHKLFVVVQTIRYVHSKDYRLDKITKKNGPRGYVNQTNISFAFFRRIVTNTNNISLSRKKVKKEKGSFSYSPIYHPVD